MLNLASSQELGLFESLQLLLLPLNDLLPFLQEVLIPVSINAVHHLDTETVGGVDQLPAHVLQVHHLQRRVLALNKSNLVQMFPANSKMSTLRRDRSVEPAHLVM